METKDGRERELRDDAHESWRDVPGYEGLYMVSDLGRVKSLARNRIGSTPSTKKRFYQERIMREHVDRAGYRQVQLWRDGAGRMLGLHRVVAMAFVPNPDGMPCVNHMDEDKANNAASNLEWCSYSYNNAYGSAAERKRKRMSRPVQCLTQDGRLVCEFSSQKEAAAVFGVRTNARISRACNGMSRTAYGFIWRFKTSPMGKEVMPHDSERS